MYDSGVSVFLGPVFNKGTISLRHWVPRTRLHWHSMFVGKDLSETNTEEDFELEESIFAELLTDTEELLEDIFSPPLDNPQEEVDIISESRTSTQQSAMDSINYEQLKQKIQYDKKVNEGR